MVVHEGIIFFVIAAQTIVDGGINVAHRLAPSIPGGGFTDGCFIIVTARGPRCSRGFDVPSPARSTPGPRNGILSKNIKKSALSCY